MKNGDKRLIEDYLPIQAISKASASEKSTRKGHIATLHLWWARRPLVACRAAVYGSLVPADQFRPQNGPEGKRDSLARANAAKFVSALCKYPGSPRLIEQAQQHILAAHAKRLTAELETGLSTGKVPTWVEEFQFKGGKVTPEDIEAGRAPRPRVLDMFAGGGAIPLEALRLGCEAYAMELNPVAYIIELCTLVYPQKYGKPDPNVRGMTGPDNENSETTWGGLAEEVRYWGGWVLEKVKAEIGDLYPPIPDARAPSKRLDGKNYLPGMDPGGLKTAGGYLTPVAYLWTRTVPCKNPMCGATVPLVRQTWLCKKKPGKRTPGRYAALKVIAPNSANRVRFEVVEATSPTDLGFDPSGFSQSGNATCAFCGTVADSEYVKAEGRAQRLACQMMCVVCVRQGTRGMAYVSADSLPEHVPDGKAISARLEALCEEACLTEMNDPMDTGDPTTVAGRGFGISKWAELFTARQMLCLLAFAASVHRAERQLTALGTPPDMARAILSYLGLLTDRLAAYGNSFCGWNYHEQAVGSLFGRQAIPMVWDFAEVAILAEMSGGIAGGLTRIVDAISFLAGAGMPAEVHRASALRLPLSPSSFDGIITDPPYYNNISYAVLSDFFYVCLKRAIGHLFPEHFGGKLTPKKNEVVSDALRHGGQLASREAYESMMATALGEAYRVLKPNSPIVVVYAHKTTLGWSSLVEALRRTGFCVREAWPLRTEYSGRLTSQGSAALASSIFLVARKREPNAGTGAFEADVRPELAQIIHGRVEALWNMEITGADLVIACVGAGLRAFTQYERVEYANGEEVPAERFLAEVEGVVLDALFARLSQEAGGDEHSLSGVDSATRFCILWRYTYRASVLDAGEAIVFANGTHVELDGPGGLSYGNRPLIEKRKGKYHLRDYTQRGKDAKLGLPTEDGQSAPLIDVLHRTLWLMENRPAELTDFLGKSNVNLEQLRLVAQTLAGPALKGGELPAVSHGPELAALKTLTSNWRSLTEGAAPGKLF